MYPESGRLGVYLGPSNNSLCSPGQVAVPLWASNEGYELINVYGSSHSNDSSMDASVTYIITYDTLF